MKKSITKALYIVLYALAACMVVYALWSLKYSVEYIQMGIAQQQIIVEGNMFAILTYYVQNFLTHAITAIVLFALGWIIQNTLAVDTQEVHVATQPTQENPTAPTEVAKKKTTPRKTHAAMKQAK